MHNYRVLFCPCFQDPHHSFYSQSFPVCHLSIHNCLKFSLLSMIQNFKCLVCFLLRLKFDLPSIKVSLFLPSTLIAALLGLAWRMQNTLSSNEYNFCFQLPLFWTSCAYFNLWLSFYPFFHPAHLHTTPFVVCVSATFTLVPLLLRARLLPALLSNYYLTPLLLLLLLLLLPLSLFPAMLTSLSPPTVWLSLSTLSLSVT